MTHNLAPRHHLRLITIPDRVGGSGTRVRAGSPAAILAVVPYLLGFLPESSLVVIGVEPPDGSIKVTMRYDLPDPADTDLAADITAHALGVIGAQELTAAVAIGYGADALVAPLARAFGAAKADQASDLIDFLRVDGGRYWSYTCTNPMCCPAEGTAFDPASYPALGSLADSRPKVLASRDDLVDSIAPLDGIVAESMRQATKRAEQHLTQLLAKVRKSARLGVARHMIATEGLGAVSQLVSTYRAGGRFATDYQVAWLTVALKDLRVRDDAWARMDPRYGEAHRRLWIDVVRRAQPGHVAAPASLLAFVAWQAGNGVLANVALDRALADDAGYSMATLLRQVISAGAPPSLARVPMTPEEVAEAYEDQDQDFDPDEEADEDDFDDEEDYDRIREPCPCGVETARLGRGVMGGGTPRLDKLRETSGRKSRMPALDMTPLDAHEAAVTRLRDAYDKLPKDVPVRLAKRTSNLFRFRDEDTAAGLDVSGFGRVLCVDPKTRTARVGGMTTYEDLSKATLRHGLMPLVVPQLKTITLGGAVTGLGIESTSLRNGMPHESVIEMEILTGDGRVITATDDNEHHELFRGFPNSYGTLGYSLSLTIELEPVQPYVHIRHFSFGSPEACMEAIAQIAADGSYRGHRADFVDGTAFSTGELYLTVGAYSDVAPWRSDYSGQQIYYQSIRQAKEDFLTIYNYLWRWDPDWFWCSRPFGVQRPLVRRVWPRKYRRSDVYRKLVAFDRRHHLSDTLTAKRQRPAREAVIQDVEIPVEHGGEFLRYFERNVGMSPVWMCPLRLRGQRAWPLYPLKPGEVYVNFGFWGTVALPPGKSDGYHNQLVEDEVAELGGHKSLYSTSFYSEREFYRRYNGDAYKSLKRAYDGDGRLLGLYEKCVRGR